MCISPAEVQRDARAYTAAIPFFFPPKKHHFDILSNFWQSKTKKSTSPAGGPFSVGLFSRLPRSPCGFFHFGVRFFFFSTAKRKLSHYIEEGRVASCYQYPTCHPAAEHSGRLLWISFCGTAAQSLEKIAYAFEFSVLQPKYVDLSLLSCTLVCFFLPKGFGSNSCLAKWAKEGKMIPEHSVSVACFFLLCPIC